MMDDVETWTGFRMLTGAIYEHQLREIGLDTTFLRGSEGMVNDGVLHLLTPQSIAHNMLRGVLDNPMGQAKVIEHGLRSAIEEQYQKNVERARERYTDIELFAPTHFACWTEFDTIHRIRKIITTASAGVLIQGYHCEIGEYLRCPFLDELAHAFGSTMGGWPTFDPPLNMRPSRQQYPSFRYAPMPTGAHATRWYEMNVIPFDFMSETVVEGTLYVRRPYMRPWGEGSRAYYWRRVA